MSNVVKPDLLINTTKANSNPNIDTKHTNSKKVFNDTKDKDTKESSSAILSGNGKNDAGDNKAVLPSWRFQVRVARADTEKKTTNRKVFPHYPKQFPIHYKQFLVEFFLMDPVTKQDIVCVDTTGIYKVCTQPHVMAVLRVLKLPENLSGLRIQRLWFNIHGMTQEAILDKAHQHNVNTCVYFRKEKICGVNHQEEQWFHRSNTWDFRRLKPTTKELVLKLRNQCFCLDCHCCFDSVV